MPEDAPNPQINVSKIQGSGGAAGAIFAISSILIFLIGIPALRYFLPAAIVLGCVVALIIHFKKHETPGQPWILAAPKKAGDGTSDHGGPSFISSFISVSPGVAPSIKLFRM